MKYSKCYISLVLSLLLNLLTGCTKGPSGPPDDFVKARVNDSVTLLSAAFADGEKIDYQISKMIHGDVLESTGGDGVAEGTQLYPMKIEIVAELGYGVTGSEALELEYVFYKDSYREWQTEPIKIRLPQVGSIKLSELIEESKTIKATFKEAVMKNARMISDAAEEYTLSNGVYEVKLSELVGPTKLIKELKIIAGESYPEVIEFGDTIVVTGVGYPRETVKYRSKKPENQIKEAVWANARMISAAADNYFLVNNVTQVKLSELVGPTKLIEELKIVAGESYPEVIKFGDTIVVTGVDIFKGTVKYQPYRRLP